MTCLLEYLKEFHRLETEILEKKTKVYSSNCNNPLQPFFDIAAFLESTPEEVILAYVMKHLLVLRNNSMGLGLNPNDVADNNGYQLEGLKQRIIDIRNYLLLYALLLDMTQGKVQL